MFYWGGGSAEPQAIGVAFCNIANDVDLYTSNGPPFTKANSNDGSYYILYGTSTVAIGTLPAGTNIMVMYKFKGGSYANGAVPQQAGGGNLTYPPVVANVLAATDVATGLTPLGTFCTAGNGNPTISFNTAGYGAVAPQQPDFGLTDVEVPFFNAGVGAINLPTGQAPVTTAKATGIYDLIFGIAVTSQLYAQKQQFSHAEIAGILSGFTTDWSQLQGDQGAFNKATLPAGPIILIDRNAGSGSKAQSSAEFLGYPALGASALTPNSVSGTGYIGGSATSVPPLNGTPPVNCTTGTYQDIQDTSAAGVVADLLVANACPGGGLRAIAILSMDNPPGIVANQNVAGVNSYDFVKLESGVDTGVAGDNINSITPGDTSYINAVKGLYTDFYQANINWRPAALVGNNLALFNLMKAQLTSPTLPGCSGSPGLKFPGNLPGTMTDGNNVATNAPNVCVGVATRAGDSAAPLFPTNNPGNVLTGMDPI
ncbi:MAG: hypothetical protein ACLPV8_27580 [Steroidobacteraceae bacterium]